MKKAENLSTTSNKDLITLIKQDPANRDAWETFFQRWSGPLSSGLNNLCQDDGEDVLMKTWKKVYVGLQTFEYRGDKALQGWLFTIRQNVINDYWRQNYLKRKLLGKEVSLERADNGQLIETIPSDSSDGGLADLELQDCIDDFAERCQLNHKQKRLVECKLKELPFPPEWPRSWIDTNWHRIKKKAKKVLQERRNPNMRVADPRKSRTEVGKR